MSAEIRTMLEDMTGVGEDKDYILKMFEKAEAENKKLKEERKWADGLTARQVHEMFLSKEDILKELEYARKTNLENFAGMWEEAKKNEKLQEENKKLKEKNKKLKEQVKKLQDEDKYEITEENIIRDYGDESEQAKKYGFGMFNPEYVKALKEKDTEPASGSEEEESEAEEYMYDVKNDDTTYYLGDSLDEARKHAQGRGLEIKRYIVEDGHTNFDNWDIVGDKYEPASGSEEEESEEETDKYDGDDWRWVYGKMIVDSEDELSANIPDVVFNIAGGGDHWENWIMRPTMNYIENKDGLHPQHGKVLVQSSCGKYLSFQDKDYECDEDECICEYEDCVEC